MTTPFKELDFAAATLSEHGAVVEQSSDPDKLDCLLPAAKAQLFGLEEAAMITPAESTASEGQALVYGEMLLDSLIETAMGDGRIAHVEIVNLQPVSGGLRGELQPLVQGVHGKGEFGRTDVSTANYLVMAYRYDAECQDITAGGHFLIATNEETLTPAPWLLGHLSSLRHKACKPASWKLPFEEVKAYVEEHAESALIEALEPFNARVAHRISRQRRHLERMHRRERKQILDPLKKDPDAERSAIITALQDAEAAYHASVASIPEQYQRVVLMQPYAALRVTLPVTRVEYIVTLREEKIRQIWLWNPLIEHFEDKPYIVRR